MSGGRVLHVMRTDGVSGAERHLEILVAHLSKCGWSSDVLLATPVPSALTAFVARMERADGRASIMRAPRDASPALLRHLMHALRGEEHDLVHTHLVHADWHAGLAATMLRTHRAALVSTKHNHDPFRTRRSFRAIERRWAARNAATIAVSESLAGFIQQYCGVTPVTVLYGMPAGPEPPPRQPPGEVVKLLSVGRLERQKGFDVLIDAVAALVSNGRRLHLGIAGAGTQEAALHRQIAARSLEASVELLGMRDDVPSLMREADLLVHPARWEGFGLVLLEAMREGLPVLATSAGAIPEVVDDGRTGCLVSSDDPVQLASAMARLLDQPDRMVQMGVAGRARLKSQFTPERMASETAAIYAVARG